MRTWWLPLAFLACSAPREPLTNTGATTTTVRVGPKDPIGWLGIATATAGSDNTSFAPENADHPLVTTIERGDLPASISAIATSGAVQTFTTGARTKILYGCDGNQLDVTALAGPRLAPGAVWLLPPSRPTSWEPAALTVASRTKESMHRVYAIGPLVLELVRTADLRGTLTIRNDGRVVHTEPFERQVMDGADSSPIDLVDGGPGIPEPIAAWSIAPSGPVLVVLTQPGYEGMTLQALLVDDSSARVIESMTTYLYHCAF